MTVCIVKNVKHKSQNNSRRYKYINQILLFASDSRPTCIKTKQSEIKMLWLAGNFIVSVKSTEFYFLVVPIKQRNVQSFLELRVMEMILKNFYVIE